jgi:hypothetical protein
MCQAIDRGDGWAAAGNFALAVSDVALVKAAVTAVGKVGVSLLARQAAKTGQTIVGEGMKRVSAAAAQNPGSVILNNMPKFTGSANQVTSQMMTYNRQWILQQMRSGRPILDIGLDATRANPSIFYQMEQNMMKNYFKTFLLKKPFLKSNQKEKANRIGKTAFVIHTLAFLCVIVITTFNITNS